MPNEVTAIIEPKSLDKYPYVGLSLCGDQIVLFSERCSGVVLSGTNAGEYFTTFIEAMYEPIGTTLDFSGSNYAYNKYPLVTKGDDGTSIFFLPYRIYFREDIFMGFDIHDNGSVSFTGVTELDFNKSMADGIVSCIDIDLHFS